MKKFMIFLLMAFLYLGTCQARSEATHFDNANVKLHSWVLPSSAQSFSMDAKAMYGEPIVKVTPSQPQNLCLSCPRNEAVFGMSYDENGSGESLASLVWMVNDHNTDSIGSTFTFGGYAAGHYTVACKVTTNLGNTYVSNYVEITVDIDVIVNIEGPDHACQNDVVHLAAQVENSSFDITYQWRRDGQYIIGANEPIYSFLVDTLPGLTDTLAYEFDVQITRAGCDSKYSPVHYFTVSPTPVTLVDVPLFCKNEPVTLTANSYTSGSEQPYMWKWIKEDDTTITYVNTLTISNPSTNDKYKVIPIYQDFACNADTAEVTLKSYQDSLGITTNLKELTLTASQDTVCLDGMVQFNVSDGNISNDKLGAATYTWYMNGTLIPDATDTTYTVALSNAGDYVLKVIASYSNYPCENPVGTDTVTVDTVPANVVITGPNVLCQNQDGTYNDTTLVAHVIPEGPSYQYKWTGQTNFKEDSSFTLTAPGVYSVIVKTQGGCEAIATFEVLGFGADVNITSTTMGCPGEPVTLSANADGWTGTVSYVWANASNPALSNNNLLTVTATTTETAYWVTSTVNLGGNETCSRTDTIKVKALEVPTPNPIVERVSADSICEGQLAIFRVKNASSITGVSQFVWYQDGIEIPGFNLDTIAVELTVPGMHGFQAAAFNPSGCASAISAADSIKVKAAPALVNITGDAVICENDSTVLRVHAEGDNLTYKWSDGSEEDSLVAHAGVYSVTVSSMEGCSAVAEFTVNTIGSEVQLTANTQNVCAGESVTLNVQATGWTSGNISYEWVDITDGHNNNQVTFVPTHDGYYKVITTVESTSGTCTRTDSIYINVDTVKIDEVAYIGGDTLCLGAQATMHVKSSSADHFIWYVNGIEIPGENLDTLRVQPDAPGFYTYSVAAISNTGCASKDTTIKPDLYILPNPTVQITGDQILCNDSTVRLVALLNDTTNTTANGANGEYTYMWRLYNQNLNSTNTVTDTTITIDGVEHKFTVKSDTLTTTLTSQDHPYIFTVNVVNANGCVAESAPYNVFIGKDLFVDVTVDHDTVCEGGLVTATAHLGDYNLENLTYQWYEINKVTSDTDTVANGTSITYTTNVDTSTVFMVKITQTTTGCTITGKDSVYVLPVKMLKIVATNETPLANETDSLFVCKGEGIYLTAYVINEETGETKIDSSFSYVWYENGRLMEGYTRPTFNKQVDIIDDDTLSYQYAAYIDFGIDGCEPQLVYSNVVFVKRNPVVTIRGNQNVCYFGNFEETGVYNVHLIAWVDGGYDTSLTYTWYEHGQVREGVGGSIYDNHYRENWIPTYDNPYSFTVMVSNSDGCVTISEPFEVNVYNKPAVNITATETTICEGGKTELTAHIDNYNEPMLTYQWYKNSTDPDNAIPGMTESVETFWPEDTTTYIVKVTHLLENGMPDRQACFNTASYVINVNDIPVIDSVTNDLADANDTICEGRFVTLTAHMHGGVPGGEVYTWYRNGAVIPEAHDSIYVETPEAVNGDITTYHYAVSVRQTAAGCESDTTQAAVVTVFPNPVLTLVTDPIVCDTNDLNIMMYANVNPIPTSPYHFTWFENNSVDTLAAATDVVYSGEHQDTIKIKREYRDYPYSFAVEMVNEYGCTVRDDALIYVNDNPVVHAISTEYNICQSEDGIITLTANLDDYNADMLEFHWYDVFNGDTTDMVAATEMSYTFRPDSIGVHNYFMTALQRNSLCIAQSNNVTVTVDSIPVIDSVTNDLAAANDTICEGRFVTLTAHVHGGVRGGEVYTWYRNGAVIPTAHDSIYIETPEALNGDITTYHYAVSVKQTAAGCESDTTQAAVVTVFPNPVLTLVTDPIVCDTNDLNIKMYANVNPIPTSPYHFTWFEDNSVDTLAAAADVVYSGEHQDTVMIKREFRDYAYSFSVQMINEFGCTVRDNANVLVNDNPVVHAISSDDTICTGGEITLTANLDDYNADMLEFHWYDVFNGDTTDMVAATNMTYTFKPDSIGTHNYFMTAQQRNSWCIAQSNNVEVFVKVDPVIKQVVLSDYIACEGAQIRVEAIADSTTYTPRATDVYTWYRNGIRIIGATNRVLYDTPTTIDQNTQQFVYTAVVTLEEPGCTSLPVDASALTIYRNPVVAITGDQHVCETDYTFLIANVDTLGTVVGNLHYAWSINVDPRDNQAYNLGDSRFFAEYLYPRDEPYLITVTVERGDIANACSSTSAPFEVYVYPKPEVNITANVYDICENGDVTLQANLNDYTNDNMTFQWYEVRTSVDSIAIDYLPGGGYIYDVVTTQYNYYIPGATGFRYTTTLTDTTTIGVRVLQTNSECYDIDETTINVHRTPAAPVIAVDNDTICSAGDATLVVTNDYSEYGTPIYAWTMDGQVIPGVFGPSYHQEPGLTSGTTHLYNAVVAFAMPGCFSLASDSVSVEVIDDPIVTVTAEGPTEICEGGSVTFSANPQPDIYNYTYQWYDYHNDLMNGETNSTLTISPDAHQQDYQYVVYVNSFPGCQVIASAPIVTVHADPRLALSIDNESICEGGISTLTVDVTGGISDQNGIDPYTYTWYSNNNTETPFAVTNVPSLILPDTLPVDTFAYWVEVSANTYGCASTSEHVNQYVVADPIVNIMVAPTYPETVCDGGSTLLLATVEGGVPGGETYQWNRNGIVWVGETDPTFNTGILSINDLNSYSVLVAQSASGCKTLSDTFSVPVIETYNVAVSALNNVTVCEGGTTTLEASITNTILPNDNPTFQWYEVTEGDAHFEIPGATSARYTTSPILTAGRHTYYVAVNSQITNAHCSAESGSVTTEVVNDPTVTVTTSAHDNVVCDGDVVRVNATVAPAVGEYTYNWTWTNGTNSGTYSNNEPTFTPTDLPASINGYLFNVSIVSTDVNSGCNATSNNNTYVVVMPRPVVTISANNNVVCAGGNVELTANHNASDYTGYNYEWYINGTRVPSTSQTITVPASMINEGSLSAIVNVTSSQITMDCPSSDTVNQLVQVLAQPTISLTSNHLTMCEGARPTLTATVAGNNNIPMTYTWNFGGQTLTGVTGNVYQSAPLAAGIYTVNVTAESQDASLNCLTGAAADAVVLRVAETPVIGLTSADGLALCEGGSVTLTATVINANNQIGDFTNGSIYGAYNYVWTSMNNPVVPHNNIALPQDQITETLNNVGVYEYNVQVTPVGPMAFGCGTTSPAQPLQVVVNARPNWDAVAVNPANGNICLGEEVQLHAHITGGVVDMNGNTNGHIQWVVEFNGVASNVSNYGGDAAHTPSEPGLYTYYPTFVPYEGTILGSGCSFTNSDQVLQYVTVHELPTAAFVSGDGTILCANVSDDNAALTIHFTGTAPFIFTVVDLSDGTQTMYTSNTNDYTLYVSPNHTTQYSITTLSDAYCSNGELGLSAIATIFVNDIMFDETFFVAECDADQVTINFNMISGTANSDFTVTYDNGMVVTGTISNNTATFATPNVPGDYNAVFSVGGCEYDIIVRRPVHNDDFSDGTVPFMMQRWDDVAIINNNPATNGGHTFVSYQWYRNGEPIPGAIYKNYQEEGGLNGFYSIEVVSNDADGRTMTYHTCEQYFTSSNSVKVYPVPAHVQQVVTIEFVNVMPEELEGATLDIYDVTGSIVEHINTVEPITTIAGFKASGTYFGRITSANGETKTVKFVIVK